MRRTWIGAASAAALAAAAWTGWAVAQQPRQEQAPAGQQMERGQNKGEAAGRGAMERGQSAQAQSQGEERQRNEKTGQGKMGEQPGNAAEKGKAAQGAQAQTEKMNGEENKTNAQGAQNSRENGAAGKQGEANRAGEPEKGKTDQAAGTQSRTTDEKGKTAAGTRANENGAGQAETGRNETQNNRQGEGGQNARAETHVNPQNVRAEGNAHLTNDRAARIADTLMATARPQNVNVDVHIGGPLPGDVDLMPLPPTIVDLVPEYRDYDYVVVNDEIVIVQPSSRHVVEVINTGGGTAINEGGNNAQAMAGTRLNPCGTP